MTRSRVVRVLLGIVGALIVAYAAADQPLYGGGPGYGRAELLIGGVGAAIVVCAALPLWFAEGVLLLTISSLLALTVVEFSAEKLLSPRYRPIYQADDRLIFRFTPGRASEWTHSAVNGGETIGHRINTQGFRGPEFLPQGATTRVVVYGDSFVHASYSSDENTFVMQLGTALKTRLGRDVEMVNAGVSSYGPDQVSLRMADELPELRPDLVVVAIFAGNDYGDLLRNKLFRLDGAGALIDADWTLDPQVRELFDRSQRESILKRVLRDTVLQRAVPVEASIYYDPDFLLSEAQREYDSYRRDGVVTNTHADYYSADVSLAPQSESARYKIRLMAAVLGRIRDVAAQNGVPLAFVFIPHPGDLADDYDSWRIDRSRFPDYDPRRQTALLEGMAHDLDVSALNLYDVLQARDPKTLFFRSDDHWNDAGQAIAASAVADFVMDRGFLTGD